MKNVIRCHSPGAVQCCGIAKDYQLFTFIEHLFLNFCINVKYLRPVYSFSFRFFVCGYNLKRWHRTCIDFSLYSQCIGLKYEINPCFKKKSMSWKKTCSFLGEWHLSCITINQRTLTTHSHYWQSYSDIVYIHMNRISFLLKCSTTAANSKCTQYISVGHVKAIIISLFFRCLLRMLEDVHSIIGLVFFTTKCSTLLNRSHSHTCELLPIGKLWFL